MTDIRIQWVPAAFHGDWLVAGGDVASTATGSDDLESAVLVSLFSDQVAPADYAFPPGETDPRGWWADTYEESQIGSRLWTLLRAKKTDDATLLLKAKNACQDALQWLLDDGVAASVTVQTSWSTASALAILISIVKPGGEAFSYAWAWRRTP